MATLPDRSAAGNTPSRVAFSNRIFLQQLRVKAEMLVDFHVVFLTAQSQRGIASSSRAIKKRIASNHLASVSLLNCSGSAGD